MQASHMAVALTRPGTPSQWFNDLAALLTPNSDATAGAELLRHHSLNPGMPSFTPLRVVTQGGQPLRILVAEDNPINQMVVLRQLQTLGYTADAVSNGIEVLQALARTPYDVVLMDCQMPGMDGYETAAEIRRREGSATHTTIIAMTAQALQGDRDKCLAAGMDDYISKPVKLEELRRALERWHAVLSARAEPRCGTSPASAAPLVAIDQLHTITGGDQRKLRDLVTLYLHHITADLAKLRTAIETGLCREVERLAHSCAGASANCGMVGLVGPLRELELRARRGDMRDAARLHAEAEAVFQRTKTWLLTWLTLASKEYREAS
jgi:CheY-like chemotaxis protein/HPt (histidine-containing phosphotransfer) domain-containing protein